MSINRMDKKIAVIQSQWNAVIKVNRLQPHATHRHESQTQSLAKETKHKKLYCAILYINTKAKLL